MARAVSRRGVRIHPSLRVHPQALAAHRPGVSTGPRRLLAVSRRPGHGRRVRPDGDPELRAAPLRRSRAQGVVGEAASRLGALALPLAGRGWRRDRGSLPRHATSHPHAQAPAAGDRARRPPAPAAPRRHVRREHVQRPHRLRGHRAPLRHRHAGERAGIAARPCRRPRRRDHHRDRERATGSVASSSPTRSSRCSATIAWSATAAPRAPPPSWSTPAAPPPPRR